MLRPSSPPFLVLTVVPFILGCVDCGADEAVPPIADSTAERASISPEDLAKIGLRIWKSECAGTVAGLTSWNEAESFASLGIGHFLWFPEDSDAIYEESFPALLDFLVEKGKVSEIPGWIREKGGPGKWPDCPWPDRRGFYGSIDGDRMRSLRGFLHSTVPLQAEFLLARFEASAPLILAKAGSERERVAGNFEAIRKTPEGKFAMIDYVNFKGEGTKEEERYGGEGWGLLQVLEAMEPVEDGDFNAVDVFAAAAAEVLKRRVRNHPPDERWILGWTRRVSEYTRPF